jgi:hypothetical protein
VINGLNRLRAENTVRTGHRFEDHADEACPTSSIDPVVLSTRKTSSLAEPWSYSAL